MFVFQKTGVMPAELFEINIQLPSNSSSMDRTLPGRELCYYTQSSDFQWV